jgi:metal-responsive CopG/Arc/MetJ family transcriptional regulator
MSAPGIIPANRPRFGLHVGFLLPEKELQRLEAYAEREGMTRSQVLRKLVKSLPSPDEDMQSEMQSVGG